jgi:hypothetical protein
VYDFKVVWDAAGNIVKNHIKSLEFVQKMHFAIVLHCFINLSKDMAQTGLDAKWKEFKLKGSSNYWRRATLLCQTNSLDTLQKMLNNIRS